MMWLPFLCLFNDADLKLRKSVTKKGWFRDEYSDVSE